MQCDNAHRAVIDLLPLTPEVGHVAPQPFETFHVIQAANLIPRLLGQPGEGI